MALTKLPKSGIADDAIDASKIEDGTIQNQELAGSLSEDKIATGTIENAKLSNSSITINGTSISLGGSSSVGVDVNWQSVITADGSTFNTASAGNGYFIDTTSAAHTINLPASASLGDQIAIKDYAGTFASNNLTIGRNGHNIQSVANDSLISTNRASLLLVYVDSTKGWIYAEESNVADLEKNIFITATGGTIATSGDFKIHTFTGDGCFVVSTGAGPRATVDYLVVAGGGGAPVSGGGGGAGGFRESHSTPVSGCYSASPLATPTGLQLTTTTYPVTVGGGGAGATTTDVSGNKGSDSIFSTITSTGGGEGFGGFPWTGCGGSGGGGWEGPAQPPGPLPGLGNTPPVSPPQGQNGGVRGTYPNYGGGGGGGSGTAGSDGNPNTGGNGGNGVTTSITGSPVARGGGGGGGVAFAGAAGPTNPGGSGGTGGGGAAGGPISPGTTPRSGNPGTTNTGGGGGAGYYGGAPASPGGSGGSGIVVIRYKFQ